MHKRNRIHKKGVYGVSRSVDDLNVKYNYNNSENDAKNISTPRASNRKQSRNFEHLSAPTFSSAVRTLDIAGVDIATVQAMASMTPVGDMSQLSFTGINRKSKGRK